jgi:hypothetical protein
MTVLFTPTPHQAGLTVNYGTGPKLGVNAPVPIYTIFWGATYRSTHDGKTRMGKLENSIDGMFDNTYTLSALMQYGVTHNAFTPTKGIHEVVTKSNPGKTFTEAQLRHAVIEVITKEGLHASAKGIYLVFTPPNTTVPKAVGYHNEDHTRSVELSIGKKDFHYGWIGDLGSLDYVTNTISHEVIESMTDPHDGTGITLSDSTELCDDGGPYAELVNGYEVASFWSAQDHAFAVYDGNSQVLTWNQGNLTVTGDQLGPKYNDTITVSLDGQGRPLISRPDRSTTPRTSPAP